MSYLTFRVMPLTVEGAYLKFDGSSGFLDHCTSQTASKCERHSASPTIPFAIASTRQPSLRKWSANGNRNAFRNTGIVLAIRRLGMRVSKLSPSLLLKNYIAGEPVRVDSSRG